MVTANNQIKIWLRNKCNILNILLCIIIVFVLVYMYIYIPIHVHPQEDAAILFRYSENFSSTGVISYNKNTMSAVEGATDFLWMIMLALLNMLGFNTYLSATTLSLLALIGTAIVLYKISKKSNKNYFLGIIIFLIFLPGIYAAIKGFSSVVFGFFVILSVYYFLEEKLIYLLISSLLACLVRPDGIVFAASLLGSFLVAYKHPLRWQLIKILIYFIIPGTIYFLWRWNYFGELLPLPFYVKASFEKFCVIFNKNSLILNMQLVFKQWAPIVAFILICIYKKKRLKK